MQIGYTCSSEEFEATELVAAASAAERLGFDFVTVSDHFHPWTSSQGHSPFAWSTIGAIAASTSKVRIGTGVTCPLIRQHPVLVAQAAATCDELSSGRFFLGVGTGEALNEHVTGERWPPIDVRQQMLVEAVDVIRSLWSGETVDHHGQHYVVENARLFSCPSRPIPIIWAASGESSARLAAVHADGLWATSPSPELVAAFRKAGGAGEVFGQLTVCWNDDPKIARKIAHSQWPNAAIGGQLSQDLPTWTHFEHAADMVSAADVAERVVCGNDPIDFIEAVNRYSDAGFTALHVHQVGADQIAFLDWWQSHVAPSLRKASKG